MSRNFKDYAKRIKHNWMNNPNSCNQICTCCGLKRVKIYRNCKIITTYITQDGVEHIENQPCKNGLRL